MKDICIFGDSLSKGVILDEVKKRYVFTKNSFVDLFRSFTHIQIVNYSKFGCTVSKGQEILDKHLSSLSEYTVLEFGGNDCDFDWAEISAAPEKVHEPKTPLSLFEKIYVQMIEAVRAHGSKPVILSMPPIDAERYFAKISAGLNAENILLWLGDVQKIYRYHEMYNIRLTQLAARCQVPLIDIRSSFLMEKNYKELLCSDGIHPTEKGHALIFREIADFLKANT